MSKKLSHHQAQKKARARRDHDYRADLVKEREAQKEDTARFVSRIARGLPNTSKTARLSSAVTVVTGDAAAEIAARYGANLLTKPT